MQAIIYASKLFGAFWILQASDLQKVLGKEVVTFWATTYDVLGFVTGLCLVGVVLYTIWLERKDDDGTK